MEFVFVCNFLHVFPYCNQQFNICVFVSGLVFSPPLSPFSTMFLCRFLHLCVHLGSLVIPGFTLIVRWISFPPPSRRHDCLHLCLVHSAVSVSLMCINSPVLFFKSWYLWIFPSFSLPPCLNLESLLFFAFLGIFVFSFTVYLTYILPVSCVAESLCHYHIWYYFISSYSVVPPPPKKKK